MKNFPEPVRPSLKNWLADYAFTVGYNNEDSIKRSNYIFHGNNTLHLSSSNREKLAYILKAHDENLPVTVNKNLKQIVFEKQEEKSMMKKEISGSKDHFSTPPSLSSSVSMSNSAGFQKIESSVIQRQNSATLHNNISFSSPQKLPYEKNKTNPYVIKPVFGKPEEKKDEPRVLPKNVVNLKDF